MYAYAYSHDRTNTLGTEASSTAAAKAASSTISDGTYTAHVRSIMTTSEDTSITFSHVTYFEGAEASSSASHEVRCPNQPIEACAPTLTRGFYVRESGAPDFTAPVPASAEIVLKDMPHASVKELQNISRQFQPVFDVVILNGNVVSITEKSPL